MNLQEYTKGAITTESRVEAVTIDQVRLMNVLKATIAAGNLLDVLKKDIFYGIPADEQKAAKRRENLSTNEERLAQATGDILTTVSQPPTKLVNIDPRVAHAIIGLATEAVELLEALELAIQTGGQIDGVNVLEELGDLNWYHAIAVDALNGDWEQIQSVNLAKCDARNKGGSFNATATINRDVVAERKLLERGFQQN